MANLLKKDTLLLTQAQQAILPDGENRFELSYQILNKIESNRAYSVIWHLYEMMSQDDFTSLVIGYKKLKQDNFDAWLSLMTTLWGKVFESDEVEQFNKMVAKAGFNDIALLRISDVLDEHQKKESATTPSSGNIFNAIKEMNFDWDTLWQDVYDKHGGFQYRTSGYKSVILHQLSPSMPQWLKDTFLDSCVYGLSPYAFKYWIDNGADPELKSLDKPYPLLMNRHVSPDARYANNKEVRELVVKYFPENRKTVEDSVWAVFVESMLESNNSTDCEVGEYIVKGYIPVPEKGSKYENKFWRSFVTVDALDAEPLINKWIEQGSINATVSARIYKLAVLNANEGLVRLLLDKDIAADKFIKSQAFKNIASQGSLLKGYGLEKNEVLKNLKIVKSHHLYNTITEKVEKNLLSDYDDRNDEPPSRLKI
jgi:hypothetical protein